MALQPINLELLHEDISNVLGCLHEFTHETHPLEYVELREAYDTQSEYQNKWETFEKFWYFCYEEMWDSYCISMKRINCQTNDGNLDLLELSEFQRELLKELTERLKKLPTAMPSLADEDRIKLGETLKLPILFLKELKEIFKPENGKDTGGGDDIEWSIPMTKGKAGRLGNCPYNKKAAWITKLVDDGELPCKELSRQLFQFDVNWFPESVRPSIRPKSKN